MPNYNNRCPSCCAPIKEGDTYCSTCYKPIDRDQTTDGSQLEGIKKSDWHMFIDYNSSRYVDVFSKNEGKKVFFNMNWAAMFFNFYWLFFRKMYKYGLIFLAISSVLTIGLSALASVIIKPDVAEARNILVPYEQYYNETGNIYPEYMDGSANFTADLNARNEFDMKIKYISFKFMLIVLIPSLLLTVVLGLLADCIYRRYIIKNIDKKSGGTSFWSSVGAVGILNATNNLIITPITLLLLSRILL